MNESGLSKHAIFVHYHYKSYMIGRQIFRKTSLNKMMTPDDLDELLQVNSTSTWLLFAGIGVILAGMLTWGFLGSISQHVQGFGIIQTQELPREIVSVCQGQVDSIFCKTGDNVSKGQKLLEIFQLQEKTHVTVNATFQGEITGLDVRGGSYVEPGTPLLEIMRTDGQMLTTPEVIFFVEEQQVSKLKKGMAASLEVNKGGVPTESLLAVITFISDYPASNSAIRKYFPDDEMTEKLGRANFHEVRASLKAGVSGRPSISKMALHSLNGLSCRTVTTISRSSPIEYLLH
jgi:hypothetical protein